MIRLAIIEDNAVYLKALQSYLRKVPDIQLVHSASNLQSLPVLIATMPDVVLMDINLGVDSGINGVQLIKKELPDIAIFMLTVFYDEKKLEQSIEAGASGYLLKKDSPKKIVEAIFGIYNKPPVNAPGTKTISGNF